MAVCTTFAAPPIALQNLPALPLVAGRLLGLLSREDVSFNEVSRLLSTDAGLAAEVLRLANSPLGGRFGATTILQALCLLGLARVHSLILTLTMSALLKGLKGSAVLRCCWRHNLASALIARKIASTMNVDADLAYMAGLMHDIGRLALLAANPVVYAAIMANPSHKREDEKRRLGLDHCEAGAWVVVHWKLPVILADVALKHHDPLVSPGSLTHLIHVACEVASQMGFGVEGGEDCEMQAVVDDQLRIEVATAINAIEIHCGC